LFKISLFITDVLTFCIVSILVIFSSAIQSVQPNKLGVCRLYHHRTHEAGATARRECGQAADSATGQSGFTENWLRRLQSHLHAHAEDSAHTDGTRPELLKDFINDSWRGMREGVLFIPGAESEGFLVYPQRSIIQAHINKSFKSRDEYIRLVKESVGQDRGDIFLSHVEEKSDWDTSQLNGLEIYNIHSDLLSEAFKAKTSAAVCPTRRTDKFPEPSNACACMG